jgi:hypothetical protein
MPHTAFNGQRTVSPELIFVQLLSITSCLVV